MNVEYWRNLELGCMEWNKENIARWIGEVKSSLEELTLDGLLIAEEEGCPDLSYEIVEDRTDVKIGCWGTEPFMVVKYPPHSLDAFSSADFGIRCRDPASCTIKGTVTMLRGQNPEEFENKIKDLCDVEREVFPDKTYVHFSCRKLASRDIDKVISAVNRVTVKQWRDVFEDWCSARV